MPVSASQAGIPWSNAVFRQNIHHIKRLPMKRVLSWWYTSLARRTPHRQQLALDYLVEQGWLDLTDGLYSYTGKELPPLPSVERNRSKFPWAHQSHWQHLVNHSVGRTAARIAAQLRNDKYWRLETESLAARRQHYYLVTDSRELRSVRGWLERAYSGQAFESANQLPPFGLLATTPAGLAMLCADLCIEPEWHPDGRWSRFVEVSPTVAYARLEALMGPSPLPFHNLERPTHG